MSQRGDVDTQSRYPYTWQQSSYVNEIHLLNFDIVLIVSGDLPAQIENSRRYGVLKVTLYEGSGISMESASFHGTTGLFLGVVKLHAWDDESYKYGGINVTAILDQESYATVPKWLDVQNGAGKILIGIDFKERRHPSVGYIHSSETFDYMEIIGGRMGFAVLRPM
ncbi:hypothetical protein SS1G_03524 [Sclerotinia sclerotiorum 1980 UF-70]|uniref:Uncharacterized protein n=1 Tax=Sclerotinia sclerotiorum (strain ATCC 18683 / 1980 / Ss-1) TaxID=665079 RepID=A7EDY4_SCLS1|nr:hypothetical protein SS1G_03524 [Sclerotinia sclerotiorum 1980 UF-70]EDO01050.1 hypothetical protein SS1G_03524 [Sclerotinia sclerotiorum 1980 UF-70]